MGGREFKRKFGSGSWGGDSCKFVRYVDYYYKSIQLPRDLEIPQGLSDTLLRDSGTIRLPFVPSAQRQHGMYVQWDRPYIQDVSDSAIS